VTPVLELAGISRDYHGLRPLRIAELVVAAGERVAILGLDAPAAEVFVNLATGRTCTVRSLERAARWFTCNWPVGLDWPEGIPRPAALEEAPPDCSGRAA